MAIPVAYNLRNLVVRKTTTIMTALGIALTVAVLLAVLALVNGLRTTLASSGDPLQIVVLRKGSESEIVSNFTRDAISGSEVQAGIANGANGQPLASLEVVTVINLAQHGYRRRHQRDGARPAAGGDRDAAGREASRAAGGSRRASAKWWWARARPTDIRRCGSGARSGSGAGDWDIVGIMDAGRGAQASEIWGDLNQVASDLQRLEVLSSALVRATDAVTAKALVNDINNDQRLNMNAVSEEEYYAAQTASAAPIEYIGIFVAVIMAVGSSFAAMNTMYAAVARRSREIGTLRVLGFSKGSILVSFFLESVLLSALGGVLGCLLVLPLNGITTGIGNSNFSETAFNFHVISRNHVDGIAFAVILGAVGGLFPASNRGEKRNPDGVAGGLTGGFGPIYGRGTEESANRPDASGARRSRPNGRRGGLSPAWLILLLLGAWRFAVGEVQCGAGGGGAAGAVDQRGQRAAGSDPQCDGLHRGGAQDRSGGQSDRQGELDRRGQGRPGQGRPGAGAPGGRRISGAAEQAKGQLSSLQAKLDEAVNGSRPEEVAQAQAN